MCKSVKIKQIKAKIMSYEKRKHLDLRKVNLHYFCYILQDSLSKGFDTTDIDNDACLFADKFSNDFSLASQKVKHSSQGETHSKFLSAFRVYFYKTLYKERWYLSPANVWCLKQGYCKLCNGSYFFIFQKYHQGDLPSRWWNHKC